MLVTLSVPPSDPLTGKGARRTEHSQARRGRARERSIMAVVGDLRCLATRARRKNNGGGPLLQGL
jgi:hypothetical protein